MVLTTFDPFGTELDQLARWALGSALSRSRSIVPMDAIRRDGEVELRFDLPGFDPGSVEVTVDRGMLTVAASRSQERTDGEKHLIRERLTGSLTRRVQLSDNLDADNVEAAYADGVLTVRIPVKEAAKPRKIEIRTAEKPELTASAA
jgi:HSP20 family protein